MAEETDIRRALDPAERYYWLLSRMSATNIMVIAELDRTLPHQELVAALASAQVRHPLLRSSIEIIDGELTFVPTGADLPLLVRTADESEWNDVIERELDTPFAPSPSPLARCVYVASEQHERALFLLTVHHAMTDGRGAVSALQHILRNVVTMGSSRRSEPLPPPLHERFPAAWRSARGALDVLKSVRAEREHLPPAATPAFHERNAIDRSTQLDQLMAEVEQTKALLDRARADGATLQGELGAAVLKSAAELFDAAEDQVLYLATPTDLRQRVEPPLPADAVMVAIGLLCTPYVVSTTEPPSLLAQRITEQTHRELDRGESHFFYRFARAASFSATDEGLAEFATTIRESPINIAVSNLGVIDHSGDPDWMRSLSVTLSAASNQVAFITVTTYRGRLTLQIATDKTKLSAATVDRLVEGIKERLALRP